MRDEDPLEGWLLLDKMRRGIGRSGESHKQTRAALDRLGTILDAPMSKKTNLAVSGISRWGANMLAPADVARACELYRRVMAAGGNGCTQVQEGLLEMIASAKDIASVPFWLEILDISRPRDTFGERRRIYALAALAWIAIEQKAAEGFAPLVATLRHKNSEVRALAAFYLSRACLADNDSLPPEVSTQLTEIAMRDTAFNPRFQARRALQAAGSPAPLDNPGGIYLLKLPLGSSSSYRIIAVRSEQTLEHLHCAIQSAVHWDADHLYSFFMNGKAWDRRYGIACPDDDTPPFTDDALIGDLGLTLKHKFLYLFDYGDCHEFMIEVIGTRPEAKRGKYPRLVESRGEAPEQYPSW